MFTAGTGSGKFIPAKLTKSRVAEPPTRVRYCHKYSKTIKCSIRYPVPLGSNVIFSLVRICNSWVIKTFFNTKLNLKKVNRNSIL